MLRLHLRLILFISILFGATPIFAQKKTTGEPSPVIRIDPPDWWIDMKNDSLQLCVYGKNISSYTVSTEYAGFNIRKINKVENPNYLFIDIVMDQAVIKAGKAALHFTEGKHSFTYEYRLDKRDRSAGRIQGYGSSDFVYLVMPDRFANGDPDNDRVTGLKDQTINRDSMFYRHGGDLKGVIDHLGYIKELGATAVWLTPIQENDQPRASYHGYAFTDHYKVDPRLGDNELYQTYVKEAHSKGLKVIQDMVYNHVGSDHWFIKDLPMHDWIHQFDTFTQTNYRATALIDPYASDFDKNKMSNGWFVKSMPDLNQQNPFLARYLIQNSLWWIETTGIDGFRIDTYTYSDLTFMSDLMARILYEYPRFNAVGELWDHCVAIEAYFMQHPKIAGAPDTHLPGLIDFQLYDAVNEALNKPMGWTEGLSRIYYTLVQDVLYSDPSRNLTFLDNHDLSRFYSVIGEDIRKYKMGIAFLLTTRGTPSLYYGTEILMKNFADPDGKVRADFPGGWKGDKADKFTKQGRTDKENEAFDFVKKLADYRKENEVLQTGKLTQFVPENDTYVYFRSNEKKTVMVIMHYSDKPRTMHMSRFAEKLNGFGSYKDVLTDQSSNLSAEMTLQPYEVKVLELMK
jgi:glycosidase